MKFKMQATKPLSAAYMDPVVIISSELLDTSKLKAWEICEDLLVKLMNIHYTLLLPSRSFQKLQNKRFLRVRNTLRVLSLYRTSSDPSY